MFPRSVLLSLLCSLTPHIVMGASFLSEVFIPTGSSRATQQQRRAVKTATDAAIAMNSVEFLEMLSGTKNTADVRTYKRSAIEPAPMSGDSSNASSAHDEEEDGYNDSSPWNIAHWIFGRGDSSSRDDECRLHASSDVSKRPEPHRSPHETVSEYVGQLWFLPDDKGIKFRETIRVLKISDDGMSSIVECTTQYHNGSRWVDCSVVRCHFHSIGSGKEVQRELNVNEQESLKMKLECEVLVWVPLAGNAVRKKIGSVFETVALDFFEGLASYSH